jgi:hypothetical protein
MWYATARGALVGRVTHRSEARDLAWIHTDATLQYAPTRHARTEPALLVRPFRKFEVTRLAVDGESTHTALNIDHGDSGSPLFGIDGAVLGVMRNCWRKIGNAPECDPTLGSDWTPAQTLTL